MTVLSARQVAGYWTGAGGPSGLAAEWVAIAMGESALDTAAVSSVGAVGLWQIMSFNAPPYGYTTADLYIPGVNATIAVKMSSDGRNCAPWDSCYADIEASGRYAWLSWPQEGSADFANIPLAEQALGTGAIIPLTGGPSGGAATATAGSPAVQDWSVLVSQSAGVTARAATRQSGTARAIAALSGRWAPPPVVIPAPATVLQPVRRYRNG